MENGALRGGGGAVGFVTAWVGDSVWRVMTW